MSGSGSVSFGSGLGPGLRFSNCPTKSMLGPGGSGWSGSFGKILLVWGTTHAHRKDSDQTRTHPDHPDPRNNSNGLR